MALTRMIFAIQMTDPKPTRLCVRRAAGTPTPAMTSLRHGDSEPSSVRCVDGSWTMDLAAGDYLIEIQVENWVPGRLDIVAELAPGQRPPTFVRHEPLSTGPSPVSLVAWEATVSYIDDSKDPWPPPPPPLTTPMVTLAQVSSEWFTANLAAALTRIAAQPRSKLPPAFALDGPVTGP